jgi:hypothetical protein
MLSRANLKRAIQTSMSSRAYDRTPRYRMGRTHPRVNLNEYGCVNFFRILSFLMELVYCPVNNWH